MRNKTALAQKIKVGAQKVNRIENPDMNKLENLLEDLNPPEVARRTKISRGYKIAQLSCNLRYRAISYSLYLMDFQIWESNENRMNNRSRNNW